MGALSSGSPEGVFGSYYRGFQDSPPDVSGAQGSMSKRMASEGKPDITGIPGPHNWLEIIIDTWWLNSWRSQTLLLTTRIANDLYLFGFKTKDELYQYIWEKSARTKAERDLIGFSGAVRAKDRETGLAWDDIPPDTVLHASGTTPRANLVIVSGGAYEDWYRCPAGRGSTYAIDPWR